MPGTSLSGRARVTVHVADRDGRLHPFEFSVDTGFDLHLTLPSAVIRSLGLHYMAQWNASLAGGTDREFEVYGAQVSWLGRRVTALVLASESAPLLGMAMLWGSRITIEAWADGEVIIEDIYER